MSAIFLAFFSYAVAERAGELFLSRKNRAAMKSRGFAQRESRSSMALMAAMHVLWLASSLTEASLVPASLPAWITALAAILFVASQALRFWTLRTLGFHWNVSVMTGSEGPQTFVSSGPYRYICHPNYLVVVIELASLPLIGGAVATAAVFSLLNAVVLFFRIRLEEQHLGEIPGYRLTMSCKPRFIPRCG